jgi:molybdopterin-binding protein
VVMVCPGPVESEIHLHTKRAAGTAVTVSSTEFSFLSMRLNSLL